MMHFLLFLLTLSTTFAAESKERSRDYRHAPTTCLTLERKSRGYEGLVYLERSVIGFYQMNVDDITTISAEFQSSNPDQNKIKKLKKRVLESPLNLVFDYKRHKSQLLKDIKAYQDFILSSKKYRMRSDDAKDAKVDSKLYRHLVEKLTYFFE
jgi:hypothetical protein